MMRRWPLRRRLTLAVGLLIVVVSAVIGTVVTVGARRILLDRIDQDIEHFARGPGGTGAGGGGGPAPFPVPFDNAEESVLPYFVVVFDASGQVVAELPSGFAEDPDPLPDVSGLSAEDLAADAGSFVELPEGGGGGTTRALVVETGDGYRLVGESLDDLSATTDRIILVTVITAIVAAVGGSLVAWLLLRRAFAPVDRMVATAGTIASGDLSHRVEHPETTTELGRLGAALDEMLTRLETADAARARDAARLREFVDDASHELRTPITTISGYADLYAEGGVEPGPQLERAMTRIQEASHRADRLVEDLLALARLDRDVGVRQETVDLAEVAAAAAEDARLSFPQDLRLDTVGPVLVTGDRDHLRQALDNLLSNARAYAPESTPIEIWVRALGTDAEVAVVDHGPGVPPELRDRVFERFVRADDSRARSSGGAGLGLAIVAGVAEAHGGGVELTDTPGGGATFTLRLPLRQPGPRSA